MADLDQLLRSDLSLLAAEAAEVPEYSVVHRAGVRRRRLRSVTIAVAAAAAVAAIGIAANLVTPEQGTAPPVAPTPTPTPRPTPTVATPTKADRIVDDPRSSVVEVVVAAENPLTRAVVWQRCASADQCRQAVAFTDDAFVTRHTRESYAQLSYLGHGVFTLNDLGTELVRADGQDIPAGTMGAMGPVRPGEVVMTMGSGIIRAFAVDPETGDTHPTAVRTEAFGAAVLPGGRLASAGFDYSWSDDNGATWDTTPFGFGPGVGLDLAASRESEPIALLERSANAGLSPVYAVHRSTDGGRTFERIATSPMPSVDWEHSAGVLPDGRLLVHVAQWSSGGRSPGLYVSNGDDWSDLAPQQTPWVNSAISIGATPSGLAVVAVHPAGDAHVSWDAGKTWQVYRVR